MTREEAVTTRTKRHGNPVDLDGPVEDDLVRDLIVGSCRFGPSRSSGRVDV